MKKLFYILILLFSFWVKNIHAKAESIFSPQQFSVLYRYENGFIQNQQGGRSSDTIDSEDSDDHPFSRKSRKRKKALLPVVIPSSNESGLVIITFAIELVCFPKTFYLFHPDFAHGERGPPSSC